MYSLPFSDNALNIVIRLSFAADYTIRAREKIEMELFECKVYIHTWQSKM